MKLFVSAIVSFVMQLAGSIFGPIGSLVLQFLPGLNQFDNFVSDFVNYVTTFATWVLSFLPFSSSFWAIFLLYWLFRLSVPLVVHTIKFVVKWWHALIP